jgi:hypothetical protein
MGIEPRNFSSTSRCLDLTTTEAVEDLAVIFGQYKILKLLLENSSHRGGWKNKLEKMLWTCRVPLKPQSHQACELFTTAKYDWLFYYSQNECTNDRRVWSEDQNTLQQGRWSYIEFQSHRANTLPGYNWYDRVWIGVVGKWYGHPTSDCQSSGFKIFLLPVKWRAATAVFSQYHG